MISYLTGFLGNGKHLSSLGERPGMFGVILVARSRQSPIGMIFAVRTESLVLAIEMISRSLQLTKHVQLLAGLFDSAWAFEPWQPQEQWLIESGRVALWTKPGPPRWKTLDERGRPFSSRARAMTPGLGLCRPGNAEALRLVRALVELSQPDEDFEFFRCAAFLIDAKLDVPLIRRAGFQLVPPEKKRLPLGAGFPRLIRNHRGFQDGLHRLRRADAHSPAT